MHYHYWFLIVFAILISSPIRSKAQEHGSCSGKEVFLEDLTRKHLENELCFPWFLSGYDLYNPDPDAINKLKKIRSRISVDVVAGSWCDDTKELLPKFYKVMDEINVPDRKISLTGVDRDKRSVDGRNPFGVALVPVFIFYYNGIEVGRIIETVGRPVEHEIASFYSSHL